MILTRAIGIDLGTTNSAVALLDPNERDLVLCTDAQGRTITPSCVWLDPRTGEIVVGHRAYARKGTRPEPISSIKRSMGTQTKVEFGGKQCSPAEISAYILQELKKQMKGELERRSSAGLRYDVIRSIVTVPAYFGLSAIEATREAGQLAGLEVTELLHEPTAAAIYYSWKHNLGDGMYMVYDLGGGTFDVSILQRTSGEFLVLGISGDTFLGGDDFDRRLAEYIRNLLVTDTTDGYDLELDVASDPEDRLRFNQLVSIAERAKKQLSEHDEIVLRDQGTLTDKSGTRVIIETAITRETFENLISDLIDRTLACCKEALKKAHLKSGVAIDDVDHILLVGGSTYIPAVVEKVRKAFCKDESDKGSPRAKCIEPIRDDPETAVALGAALRAATSGLGVADDDRHVRLWFRGVAATKREQTNISGHVEPLQKDLSLEGGRLRLTNASGEPLGEIELKPGLTFAFPKVALDTESLNDFRFEVLTSAGDSVASLQRSVAHSSSQKDAVGGALSTAVLPKPILLEGTDGDRMIRRVLLPEGTSLPAKAQFTFAVADPSGQIRLPIYQESRIIKELRANVGSVSIGTPVEVEIACDEQVHIQVRFSIGDKEFGGRMEPPPPDAVPTEHDIQLTDTRFHEALTRLDEEDARRLRADYQRARHDLDEARSGADYPKVIQRAADLEGLVREARLAEPLRPSLDAVEKNYSACLQLLPEAAKIKPDLTTSSFKQDIEAVIGKARQAYKQRDHQSYGDASQGVAMALQFLVSVVRVKSAEGQNVDVAVQAAMGLEQARHAIQFLLFNCLRTGQTVFIRDLMQHAEEINSLEDKAGSNPDEVIRHCQVLMTEVRRIYQQIAPEERRAADLEGLLRVPSKGLAGDIGTSTDLFGKH